MNTDKQYVIREMAKDILAGASRMRVKEKLLNDRYDVVTSHLKRAAIEGYIKDAYDMAKPKLEEDMQEQRRMFIARYEDILADARDQNDRTNAVAALREMGKILGIYEPDKIEVDQNIKVIFSFGLEEKENEE